MIDEFFCNIRIYRIQQNRYLNTQLNLLFWELGKRINQTIQINKKGYYRKLIFKDETKIVLKKYGKCFSKKQLIAMALFATKFTDLGKISWISSSLS